MRDNTIVNEGYDALWLWFGLSYASWLTIPRVLCHEMPDDWQRDMARLLREFDAAFPGKDGFDLTTYVTAKRNGKFVKLPSGLNHYRHPDMAFVDSLREPIQSHD